VESFDDFRALDRHAREWDDLAEVAKPATPMLSHAWISAFLRRRLPAERAWQCLLALAEGRLVGVLPLVRMDPPRLGRLLATWRAPEDYHTYAGDVLLAPSWERAAFDAFAHHLRTGASPWEVLELPRVRDDSPTMPMIRSAHGFRTLVEHVDTGLYLPVRGTFGEYLANLKKGFRQNLRTALNRAARLGTVEWSFHRGGESDSASLDRFLALETSGWKGSRGSAIAASPNLLEYYRDLTSRLAERRWLEFQFLAIGGRTVAGQMAVRIGRTLFVPKVAYDESFAECSPGNLLLRETLERTFADGQTDEVNMLSRYHWLERFGLLERPYHRVRIFRPGLRSWLLGLAPARARARLRTSPTLRRAVRAWRRIRSGRPEGDGRRAGEPSDA
jgi:CelD/BcsL family acetyltransferase involved in cellulose biosynthesis